MGCDLEVYRARVGTWAASTGWLAQGGNSEVQVKSLLVNTCLCAAVLTLLLFIGGVEQNRGLGVVGASFMQVVCSGCDRSLKSGTQSDTCGRWFHNSCGNATVQFVDSGKWNCEMCKWERLCLLEVKLQKILIQIEDLISKNKPGRTITSGGNCKGYW
jgi:hypothetical protein